MIDDVARALSSGSRFLVTSHKNPDGDAIGSMLGAARLLRDNGKAVAIFHPDPVPGPYLFLSGADEVESDPDAVEGVFDGVVIVDVGERERIADRLPAGADRATFVVVDHHMSHGDLGDVVFRRPASAVGEMLVELGRHLGWAISTEFAECAYTAILSDTGSFRYSSTTAEALETAAFLVSKGVQPWKVASHVYETWPFARLRLLGEVLGTLALGCEGQLASMVVTAETLARCGASSDMTEGFVNYGRMVAGVEVAALLRELGPDLYRLSLRSRGRVDVSSVASDFGGGGHPNAAGGTVRGPLAQTLPRLESKVQEALDAADTVLQDDCWSRR